MANYLKEAFQSLDLIEDKYLKEETFQLGKEKDIEELEDMIEYNENGPDIEEVVDLDAESIEEVKDSYVGDIVIQCPNCTHMYYKTEDEIKLEPKSEESDTLICNVGEECYYCGSESGYDVIGRVTPYEEKVEVKEKEVEKERDGAVEDEEEFDEVSFDEHFNTYLSENYKNRVIYSTKRVYKNGRGLIVEGVMEFGPYKKSGIKLTLSKRGNKYKVFNENLKTSLYIHTSNKKGKIITEEVTVKKPKKDLMSTKGTIAYVFKGNLDKITASGSLDKMKEEAIKLLDSEEITQSEEKIREVKSRLKAVRNIPQFMGLLTTYALGVKAK